MYRSEEYSKWRQHALWAIVSQIKGMSIKGEYVLDIKAVKPDKRRRDIGNLEKAVSDILQSAKIIEDDYLCQDLRLRWAKTGPECLITLRPYDGEEV
jgi:crossover junction endodeoxyribonuclease RusA